MARIRPRPRRHSPARASRRHRRLPVSHLADSGLKASSIGRRCAAIAYHHKQAGVDHSPTATAGVRAVLAGIRRTLGTKRNGKAPIVADMLLDLLKHCQGDKLIDKRNRALISLGFACALRRSELVALEVSDLVAVPDGLRVIIRRSKTDQSGEGAEIAVIRGVRIRPVLAVEEWIAASGITAGPLFRAITLGGVMSDGALKADGFARVLKRLCRKAGIAGRQTAAHPRHDRDRRSARADSVPAAPMALGAVGR
jgi:integrase